MSDDTHPGAGWSASALRAEMAAREMKGLDAEAAARKAEAARQREFRIDFLMHHLSPRRSSMPAPPSRRPCGRMPSRR